MSVETRSQDEVLPQIIGEFSPVDVWQGHMNRVFYGLRGHQVRKYYQTFAAADYRLAYALAADYVDRVKAREQKKAKTIAKTGHAPDKGHSGHVDISSPLTIMEWGCGNGNLAACFLDHVKELDQEGTIYPRIHYVLIDVEDSVLQGAKANLDLAKHQDRMSFSKAQVEELKAFPDGSVDRIFCNELWNELSTKLILRKGTELQEEHLRPNLKESRLSEFPDWSGFVNAFLQADSQALQGFPHFLDDILWEREYHKVEGKDLPFRRLVTDFLKQVDEEILVPVNLGAAHSLKEAQRLLAPDGIGFSSFDAGTTDWFVLNDAEKPCYGLHGGQFSFMVNFPFLEKVANQVGASQPSIEPQKEFVGRNLKTNVMSLMDLLASHPGLPTGGQWEIDRLILKTLQAVNERVESPYQRHIEFPLDPGTPADSTEELQKLVSSMKQNGVPDTIAYLTEDDVFGVMENLEQLGYSREGIRAAFMAPPQSIDYYHFYFGHTV